MDNIYTLIAVAMYLAVLGGISIAAARRMKDLRDYFAAGKQLGFLAVAFSARATGESAWLLLGLTGMGAAMGVKAFWLVLGETLGVVGAWVFMARRFKRLTDRYDSVTVPDYLESRFGDDTHKLRVVAAAALSIFVTIYVSAQIDATGAAFETFLGWNYYVGAAVGFGVVLVYITSGGFVAVAWSDVFQGTLMFLGLVILPVVGLVSIGGWEAVSTELVKVDPSMLSLAGEEGWTVMGVLSIVSLCLLGLGFLGSPQIFVRYIALKDEGEISKGTIVAGLWTIFADGGAVLVGLVGRAILTGEDLGNGGQDVLPLLVDHLMPAFVVGIYIAIVLSAIMSTVDSLLVVAGSAAVRDVYQKVLHPDLPDDELVSLSRKVTFVLALIAFAIAMAVAVTTPERTIFWFVIFGWSGIAATFCPTIILSLFWRGFTRRGVLAAMVTGFVSVPLFKFGATALPEVGVVFETLNELPPAFATSFVAGVLFSLGDEKGKAEVADIDLDV